MSMVANNDSTRIPPYSLEGLRFAAQGVLQKLSDRSVEMTPELLRSLAMDDHEARRTVFPDITFGEVSGAWLEAALVEGMLAATEAMGL